LMSACCGASVACTSCETRLLTSMTEPPAAPALLLEATETGVVVVLLELMRFLPHQNSVRGSVAADANANILKSDTGRAPYDARPA